MSFVDTSANSDRRLVRINGSIGGIVYPDITTKEIIIGESLLNPGLMLSMVFQSKVYDNFDKVYMRFKNQPVEISLSDSLGHSMRISNMMAYRLDNRAMMPLNMGRTEEFTLHAVHETLLDDARHTMSKTWKCTTPDRIVSAALECVKAGSRQIDGAGPARDYMAENIHPYQVIQQQCNVALDGDDPSFIHWMTYENGGQHYFRSLKRLINQGETKVYSFRAADVNVNFHNDFQQDRVIVFEFPCMFDYLSDILNGVEMDGSNINSVITNNAMTVKGGSQFLSGIGGMLNDGCFVGGNVKQSLTNKGSGQDYGCQTDVESHLLLRQARMALLDRDKIALRLTVPWDPTVHAGNRIRFNWYKVNGSLMPDSDSFIVASLTHKIQFGGFSTTSLDCIRARF